MSAATRNVLHERRDAYGNVTVRGEFDTLAQAEAARSKYLDDYHPMGYGTALQTTASVDGFVIEGHRWRSCE